MKSHTCLARSLVASDLRVDLNIYFILSQIDWIKMKKWDWVFSTVKENENPRAK